MNLIRVSFAAAICLLQFCAGAQEIPTHNPFKKPDFNQASRRAVNHTPELPSISPPVLSATLAAGSQPLAIIEGKVVGLGEEINGYRLISIGEGEVIFTLNGTTHKVEVKPADSPAEKKELVNAN